MGHLFEKVTPLVEGSLFDLNFDVIYKNSKVCQLSLFGGAKVFTRGAGWIAWFNKIVVKVDREVRRVGDAARSHSACCEEITKQFRGEYIGKSFCLRYRKYLLYGERYRYTRRSLYV